MAGFGPRSKDQLELDWCGWPWSAASWPWQWQHSLRERFLKRLTGSHRLQPLRIFQLVYVVMILIVGAVLGERVLQRRLLRWATTFGLLAVIMFFVQRHTFSSSAHLELPHRRRKTDGSRRVLWISRKTPKDALFAPRFALHHKSR